MPGTRTKAAAREAAVQRNTRSVEQQGMGDAWAGLEECDEATAGSAAASGSGRALDVFAGSDSGGSAAVLDEFLAHACSLDSFLQPSPSVAQLLRRAAKVLFDTSTAGGAAGDGSAATGHAGGGPGAGLLHELYVDGFEVEQIWLQVELLMRRLLQRAQRLCKRMPAGFALYPPELDADLDTLLGLDGGDTAAGTETDGETGEDDTENGEAEGMPSGDSEDGSMGDGADLGRERGDAVLEADAKEGQAGEVMARKRGREAEGQRPRSRKARKAGASERGLVEDRFFNLHDLDRFLQQAEREEQELREQEEQSSDEDEGAAGHRVGEHGGRDGNDTEEEEEEEALDVLLQQANERAGRTPSGGKADGAGGGIMARDFFDDVGSTGTEEEDDLQEHVEEEEEEEEEEEGGEGSDGEGAGNGIGTVEASGKGALSAYERRVAALKETIQNLEEEAMGEQPWQLRGEIQGKQRPLDSALELDMDFESSMPPPPAPTEATTTDLEEMIKRRIVKYEFDDVVRMEMLQHDGRDGQEKRKQNQLDDSKNAAGLGELYEHDYLRAAVGGEAEDRQEPIRRQVRQLFRELSSKLDALSHFHFAPKPVIEELKVTPSAPAIAMEEVAPATVSTADQRAPEEVFQHKAGGTPAAEEELSREERKRRRAKKKLEGMKAGADRAERRRQQQLADAHTASDMVPASQKRRSHLQKGSKTKVGNIFKQLQDAKEQPAAAAAAGKKPGAATLKL